MHAHGARPRGSLPGFDPWRREVARRTIERLIADGRIHPARIEEVVEAVRAEMIETATLALIAWCEGCSDHRPGAEAVLRAVFASDEIIDTNP